MSDKSTFLPTGGLPYPAGDMPAVAPPVAPLVVDNASLRQEAVDIVAEASTGVADAKAELADAKVELTEAKTSHAHPRVIAVAVARVRAAQARVRVAEAMVGVAEASAIHATPEMITLAEARVGVAEAKVGVAEAMVGVAEASATHATPEMISLAEARVGVAEAKVGAAEARVRVAEAMVGVAEARAIHATPEMISHAETRVGVAEARVGAAEARVGAAEAKAELAEARAELARHPVTDSLLHRNAERCDDAQAHLNAAVARIDVAVAEVKVAEAFAKMTTSRSEDHGAAKMLLNNANQDATQAKSRLHALLSRAQAPAQGAPRSLPQPHIVRLQPLSAFLLSADCDRVLPSVGYNFDIKMRFDPTPDRCIEAFLWPATNHNYADKDLINKTKHALYKNCLTTPLPVTVHETKGDGVDRRKTQVDHLENLADCEPLSSFLKVNGTIGKQGSMVMRRSQSISDLCMTEHLVTGNSIPDGFFLSQEGTSTALVFGIVEVKHDVSAPKMALTQAQGYCSNVAYGLMSAPGNLAKLSMHHRNAEHIPVPCMVSNGRLVQFGATIILSSNVPCHMAISNPLDLASESGRTAAAMHLLAIYKYGELLREVGVCNPVEKLRCEQNLQLDAIQLKFVMDSCPEEAEGKPICSHVLGTAKQSTYAHANQRCYVLKPLMKLFLVRANDYCASLHYMFDIFGKLYAYLLAREYVVFPYCVLSSSSGIVDTSVEGSGSQTRSKSRDTSSEATSAALPASKRSKVMAGSSSGAGAAAAAGAGAAGAAAGVAYAREFNDCSLLFDNLLFGEEAFRCGLPDSAGKLIGPWLAAVQCALHTILQAGVVHVDLYISNIMWRYRNSKYEIKIIDWDSAHQLGEKLTAATSEALAQNPTKSVVQALRGGSIVSTAVEEFHGMLPTVISRLVTDGRHDLLMKLCCGKRSVLNPAFKEASEHFLQNAVRQNTSMQDDVDDDSL
jgi:hypothetical protein